MNNRTSKRSVKAISAAVLSTALVLTASAQFAFAADTSASSQNSAAITVKQSSDRVQLTSKNITKSTDQLETDLEVPIISGMKDAAYQSALNANIAARAKAVVDLITKQAADAYASKNDSDEFRPYGVTIKFELISDGSTAEDGILSFKVLTYTYTGGAHGGTVVSTYNVRNEAKASQVKLKDLFGTNFKSTINRGVKAEIASRPDDFFADQFQSISDNQAFYIRDGIAYIIFQQYEIAPYAAGTPEIAFVIPGIGVSVPASAVKLPVVADGESVKAISLYTAPGGIVMAPLRPIAQALGYTISYDARTHQTKATKGNDWAKVKVDQDRYAFTDMASFTLGAAPAAKGGALYVPLDYFAKVLHVELSFTKEATVLTSAATK